MCVEEDMERAKITRENIILQAAGIFNQKGFAGASLADLMEATGLKKGGIYNHFESKDEIVFESFDFAVRQINKAYYKAIRNLESPLQKLVAIINYYRGSALNPVIKGGCPILNTVIDSDNTHPELKKRARQALNNWINNIAEIIEQGKHRAEIKNSVDAAKSAAVIIASIEGGHVLARGLEDLKYMDIVAEQLLDYIHRELQA